MHFARFIACWPLLALAASPFIASVRAEAQVSAPEMVAIPAGGFLMGSEEGATWEKPVHRVEVSAFFIAARPVTNGQFRAFRPDHVSPVNNAEGAAVRAISWEQADAYCRWLGENTGDSYRLPTEAEWERAIRGGLEQMKYPWGDESVVPDAAVGSRSAWPPAPPNKFGLFIEHELWEWAADFYHRNYYQDSPPVDPKGPADGEFRVLRGGSYPNDPNSMRCANRGSARPKTTLPNVTFRVARDAGASEISQTAPPPPVQAPAAPQQPVTTAAARTQATPPRGPERQPQPQPRPIGAIAAEIPARAPAASSAPTETPSPAPQPQSPPARAPAAGAASGGPVQLTRVDVTVSSEQVILVLSLSGPAEHSTMELNSPDRLVVDLANTEVATVRQYGSLAVADLGVERVRWAPFEAETPTARLVIDLTAPMTHTIESAPSGLVIQIRPR